MARWGPTDIATNSDDVMGDGYGYKSEGYLASEYIDDTDTSGGWWCTGLRFSSIDLTQSVNNITITAATLSLPRANDNSGANGSIGIKCVASNTPATWSTTNRPASASGSLRSASAIHIFPANGVTQSVDVKALVQDLVDAGYTYNGAAADAIAFTLGGRSHFSWACTANISWRLICYDLNSTGNAANLTIDYTATAIPPAISQTGVPIASSVSGEWWPKTAGNNLWQMIDEITPSDADYIWSSWTAANNIAKVSLSALTDPQANTGHTIWYRVNRGGTNQISKMSFTAALYEGTTLVAQNVHADLPTTYTTSSLLLSAAEADAITNYGNLALWFFSTSAA